MDLYGRDLGYFVPDLYAHTVDIINCGKYFTVMIFWAFDFVVYENWLLFIHLK